MTKRSREPLLWLMFSAGGVLAAMMIPILVLFFGILFPLGVLPAPSYSYLQGVLRHPLSFPVLFVLCCLSLIHAAHRFRYTLYDGLQIKHMNEMINLFCYGGAIFGSIVAAYLLWTV
jgi:fumarate reductase subunit D